MVVYTFNPSHLEAEAGGSSLVTEWNPVLQKREEEVG